MSADIQPIGPREHVERFAPDPVLAAELEQLLEHAKSGKLRSLTWGAVLADNLNEMARVSWSFTLNGNTMFGMSHAILMINRRWTDHCNQASAPPLP